MKKTILVFISLLFTTLIFAQIVNTSIPITGLGNFALGMTPEETMEVLEECKSIDTKISGILDGESSLIITNVKCFGYLFNECFFTFIDDKLDSIYFSMYFDKKNKDPKEFEELLSILENDYGKNQIPSYVWENEDKTKIMLFKVSKKKKTSITISVIRDIFNLNNLEVYK